MFKNKRYKSGTCNPKPIVKTIEEDRESSPPVKAKRIEVEHVDIHENDDLLCTQASIPASQPPTQRRYLSQRSLALCKTQSRTLNRAPNSYFEMIIMKAGADLDQENVIVLSYDNVTFVNRLCNLLNKNQDNPNAIDNFIDGFRDYLNNRTKAIKLLIGCTINLQSTDVCIQSQDSVIVNILMVENLQQKIIGVLLDRIENIAKGDSLSEDISLLPLILSQLRLVSSLYSDMLYDRIMKIYEEATSVAKNEITMNMEFILDPVKHDDFVCYLLENSSNIDELLNKSTIKMFTNFSLSSRVQTKIRKKILKYIKDGCQISLLPSFIRFLLTSIWDDDNVLVELITDLRKCLDVRCNDLKNENNIQLEIFECISQGLIRSRKMYDNWLKIIQNTKDNEIKSIDFLTLLMLISIREEKSNLIENLLRRWIKQERIKVNVIIIEAKKIFPAILEEYKDLLFRILHDFLREKNQLLFNFSKQAYRILFTVGENYQKKVLIKLVELICDKSMLSTTSITLEVLRNLNEKYMNEMQNCGLLLLPLLDRINEMNLNEFRTVMEILCSISYPQPPLQECEILKDQIDMLIKKQTISQISVIKKQGIIGTVQLVYHISCTEELSNNTENIYNLNNTYNSIEELPDGRGKLAANYITRVFAATNYCVESLALFYNEMAMAFSPRIKRKSKIERHFLIWLCDLITSYFQNYFIVEDVPTGLSLKLAYKNCINSKDDNSGTESELIPIAINISGPVLKPSAEASLSIVILPPLFNLMRVLHFIRYEGSLESINAVLGCAVILPESFDNIEKDIFEEYDEDMAKKIIDIHFHLINWYREIIGSFASQNDQMIKKKVLIRLNELIKIEDNVQDLLSNPAAANYIPPNNFNTSNNNSSSPVFKKPMGKPKKAKPQANNQQSEKNKNDSNTEEMFLRTQNRKSKNRNISSGKNFNYLFRQMDFNIVLILREKFNPKISLSNEELGTCIGLLEFNFILSDLVEKVESITGVKKMIVADDLLQYIRNASDLIEDIIHFLPIIMKHFKMLTENITAVIESVKGVLGNSDLFTNEFNYLKICHGLCLRLYSAIFSWTDFEDESNRMILKAALCALNDIPMQTQESNILDNINEYAEKTFNNFIKLDNCIIDLKSAVHLYNLCLSLKKFAINENNNDNLEKSIFNLCRIFLCKKWYNYTGSQNKGASCNTLLNELLNGLFKKCDFKKLKGILKLLTEEIKFLQKKDNVLKTFPNINKLNFPMVFKHLCSTLICILNENFQTEVSMKQWEQACDILNSLLNIVKSLDVPRNFSLFLKCSHNFLKIFIQQGLPICEKFLRKDPEKVNELLKSLQATTRFLHNLCCHSKAIKQSSIVAQIPFVRETVENLVFKVKAALAANKCSSVFWMGDLKNKDLQGDVILSQSSSYNESDHEDELPPEEEDDDDDDENINETVIEEGAGSSSKKSLSESDSL